jgi:ribosome-associated protein
MAPSRSSVAIEALELAAAAARLADQKKGAEIRVLQPEDNTVSDYVVLITGHSRPQVRAIFNEIHVRLKTLGETHGRAEGVDLGWWVLMDYGTVVVHILQPEAREYYDLDGLYGDAQEIDWKAVAPTDRASVGQ